MKDFAGPSFDILRALEKMRAADTSELEKDLGLNRRILVEHLGLLQDNLVIEQWEGYPRKFRLTVKGRAILELQDRILKMETTMEAEDKPETKTLHEVGEKRMLEIYDQTSSDKEMAKVAGVSYWTDRDWRRRRGLPCKYKGGGA